MQPKIGTVWPKKSSYKFSFDIRRFVLKHEEKPLRMVSYSYKENRGEEEEEEEGDCGDGDDDEDNNEEDDNEDNDDGGEVINMMMIKMMVVVMIVMMTKSDAQITEYLWTEGMGGVMIRQGYTRRFKG